MSEKDLNKSGCSCGNDENGCCGEHTNDHSCNCGGHDHEHDHDECGCGEFDHFVVDLEDENGNVISCDVVDAFEYKEVEYVLVQNPTDGSVYLFKSEGEEGGLVVPEEEEFNEVTKYYEEELAQ